MNYLSQTVFWFRSACERPPHPHPDLEGGDGEEAEVERLGGDRLGLVEHGVDAHGKEHERHHHGEALHAGVVGPLRPHEYRHPGRGDRASVKSLGYIAVSKSRYMLRVAPGNTNAGK